MKKRGFGVVALALCLILIVSINTVHLTARAEGVEPEVTWLSKNYDYVGDFSDGMAAVQLNNKWGFIDKTGKVIIPLKYDTSIDASTASYTFSEGLANVGVNYGVDFNLKFGFIDKVGKVVIPLKYDSVYPFSGGLAAVQLNNKWGFIDKTGKVVVPIKYKYVYSISEGLLAVKLDNKWGFIDKTGKVVVSIKYDFIYSFSEGLAAVELNDKMGYIDKTGKVVIPIKYKFADSFSGGLAAVGLNNGCGFIDKTGKVVIPLKYDSADSFSGGIYRVGTIIKSQPSDLKNSVIGRTDYTYKYIDKVGNEVDEPLGVFGIFNEGLAYASHGDNKYGYLDINGNEVIPFEYDVARDFNEGVAFVQKGNKQGIIKNPLTNIPIPKIAIVSLDHVPFVEGDNNEFYISAQGYTGQVQYQLFYIQESVMKEWKLINNADMINGWTNPIDAQAPINVDISSLNLKADKYRFAIRVRRVGVTGLKQNSYGDYDDAYPFNLDVVKNANIKLSDNINIEKTYFTKSENLVINGVGNLSKDIQYKLHLFDVKNSKWLTDLTEYNTDVNYSLKNIPEGTYIVDLWARNINSNTKYDGWKLKLVTVSEVIPISLNKTTSSLIVDGEDKLTAIINTIESTSKSVTWTSSNDTIAKVDDTGKVTALKIGTATITATTADKALKATCKVTVSAIDIPDNTDITSKFTDVNFKTIVYELIGKANPAPILYSDVKNIPQLEIDKRNISSLSGIEYFTALTWLRCGNNQLTILDVSKNVALDSLVCPSNQLTTLDVSENTALRSLYCADNRLTTLDVSKNTALIDLSCSRNQLTTLDVSKNAALVQLFCASNQLTTLDVSKNTALTFLYCPMNPLTTLDVSKNIALTDLGCSSEQLTTLDVSKNIALTRLLCSSTQLTTLDVSKNIALTELHCPDSQLTTLDVSKNTALTRLNCSNNQLTTLEVSKNIGLTDLNCYGNQLTTLDVSKNTALTKLNCSNNQLTALEVSKNTESPNFDYKAQFTDSTHTTSTWDLIKIIKK